MYSYHGKGESELTREVKTVWFLVSKEGKIIFEPPRKQYFGIYRVDRNLTQRSFGEGTAGRRNSRSEGTEAGSWVCLGHNRTPLMWLCPL